MSESQGKPPASTDKLGQHIDRLKTTMVGVRHDLKVSRHIFRGVPSYIVHDPVSFQSHRFSQSDYRVLSSLHKGRTLDDVYQRLSDQNVIPDDEKGFYEFVISLQMRGLLDLPILDSGRLHSQFKKREALANRKSLMKLLFLKIPLFNPDAFLDRTIRFAKPLFTKSFMVLWAIMMVAAMGLLAMRWEDFCSPLVDLLATRNLIVLVLVMTFLKFWHELGHAYACKIHGGAVPDMGAFFMAGMPLAYVDVSSSWSFASRRQRILVGLGGMYFESIAAAIAMFVWAFTSPGIVNSVAHFCVLMASLMTVLFNANPLMRYDGYYVLSDLSGIPNLRGRSTQYITGLMKKVVLGLPMHVRGKSFREMVWMTVYGVASVIYQTWLMISISLLIASQFFLVGMVMGAMVGIRTLVYPLKSVLKYLWFSPEVAPVRMRAVCASGLLLSGLFALIGLVPVPGGVVAKGQLTHEELAVVRLPFDCQLTELMVHASQQVKTGEPLLRTENKEVSDGFHLASAEQKLASMRVAASANEIPAAQKSSWMKQQQAEESLRHASQYLAMQSVNAPFDGTVLNCPEPHRIGDNFVAGESLLKIARGNRIVRVLLNDVGYSDAKPKVGDRVDVRLSTSSQHQYTGTISRIEPAGSDVITLEGLTQIAGGDVIVDPLSGRAIQTHFLIDVELQQSISNAAENMTAAVRFDRQYESVGAFAFRHLRIFINQLNSK